MNTLTIVALVHATPNAIYRMLSVCRRYRVQIESVTVARTERDRISRLILVVSGTPATPFIGQLRKLVDVIEVYIDGGHPGGSGDKPLKSPLLSTPSSSLPLPSHSAQADGAF